MAADNPMRPVEVPAIPFRPRSRGLLTDVTVDLGLSPVRPDGNGTREYDPADRVGGGVEFCSDGCGGLNVLENQWCVLDEAGEGQGEAPIFFPSDYYEALLSGPFYSFWVQGDDLSPARYPRDLASQRVEARLKARFSAAIARELLTGAITDSPSLSTSATVVVETPVDLAEALYVLEEILADWDGLEFTIHSSPGLFELLVAEYDIAQDDRESVDDPNRLPFRTANGHKVVGDAGHDGSVAPTGFDTAENGSWLYASGDVALWRSEIRPVGDETANFDRDRNTWSTVKGRDALVAFDECMVVAVQVEAPTYTPEDGPGAPASGD